MKMQDLLPRIFCLPKDLQRLIVSYVIPTQNHKLLEDIRSFSSCLSQIETIFLERSYKAFQDVPDYTDEQVYKYTKYMNYIIFYKLLVVFQYYIPESPLFMVTKEWFQKYQIMGYQFMGLNFLREEYYVPIVENKIRFIFGIITPFSRDEFIDKYCREEDEDEDEDEEEQEEEDYDW